MTRPFKTTAVTQMQAKRGLLFVIYGPPGVGKTTSCANATASEYARPGMFVDVEAGVSSITHMPNIEVVDPAPKKWADIRTITRYYRDTPVAEIEERLVVWDNGSEIHKMALDFVVTDPSQVGGARTSPEIQHWGRSMTEFELWVRTLRDIATDKGIIMMITAWDRRRGGGDAPDTESAPAIAKDVLSFNTRLAEELPGLVDIVGYMTVRGDGKRLLTFDASPRHSAKFRRNKHEHAAKIPKDILFGEDDNPLADIINTLKGGKPFPDKYLRRMPAKSTAQSPASATASNGNDATATEKENT